LAGTVVTFFSINKVASIGNADIQILYGETDDTAGWDSTAYYNVKCFFQKPDYAFTTTEGGLRELTRWFGNFALGYFQRLGLPMPKEGDIVEHGTFDYYDVKKVTREGYYADGQEFFVEYRCEIETGKTVSANEATLKRGKVMKTNHVCEWLDFCQFQLRAEEYETLVPVNLVEEIKEFASIEEFIFSCSWINYDYEIEANGKKYKGCGGGHFVKIGKDFYFVGKVNKPWSQGDCGLKAAKIIPRHWILHVWRREAGRTRKVVYAIFSD